MSAITEFAEVAKQLRYAREQLTEATSFIFVCLQALQPGCSEVDATEEILTVMGSAYIKLVEEVQPNLSAASKAFGDGDE